MDRYIKDPMLYKGVYTTPDNYLDEITVINTSSVFVCVYIGLVELCENQVSTDDVQVSQSFRIIITIIKFEIREKKRTRDVMSDL